MVVDYTIVVKRVKELNLKHVVVSSRNSEECDRKTKLDFNYFDNTNIIIVNFTRTAHFINPFFAPPERVAHKIPGLCDENIPCD